MKESTGQEPYKSIKEKFVEMIRNYLKKKITGNLGNVCETEDKLICYVRKEKCGIEKSHSGYDIYHIDCVDFKDKYKELVEKYNLNKQIVYVLDGLIFNRNEIAEITGIENIGIEIKNCKFEFKFKVMTSGDCSLRNVIIEPIRGPGIYIGAKNITMNSINIQHPDALDVFAFDGFSLQLKAKNSIELKDLKVGEGIFGETRLEVEANFINMCNSTLRGKNIAIVAKNIQTKNSLVAASGFTLLDVEEFNELDINSPLIEYNNRLFVYGGKTICLKPIDKNLDINRQAVLSQLRGIKANLEEQNKKIVETVITKLNNQSVGKRYNRIRKKSTNR